MKNTNERVGKRELNCNQYWKYIISENNNEAADVVEMSAAFLTYINLTI